MNCFLIYFMLFYVHNYSINSCSLNYWQHWLQYAEGKMQFNSIYVCKLLCSKRWQGFWLAALWWFFLFVLFSSYIVVPQLLLQQNQVLLDVTFLVVSQLTSKKYFS